ncbi:MAG: hypothetical protein LPK12_15670 [Rhodobacterales bacterium]|nr:hypothetical protein [Rhodobacterales bacterium]MDX5501376.1 hypothetical protein [Rhodobacterales bacterium]
MTKEHSAVTGAHLIDWGHRPGPQFPDLLARANAARDQGLSLVRIRQLLEPDLPLSFHPAATGVGWFFTPFGAE